MGKFLIRKLIKNYEDVKDPKVRQAYGKFAGIVGIVSNLLLCVMKIIIGLVSSSIAIIADGVNNLTDASSSIITLVGFKMASQPEDKDHPYGHGKIENISGVVEGVLIFIAAGMIIVEAAKKLFEPAAIDQAFIAIAVMMLAALVNFFVSRKLYQVAKEEDSMALEADALHLKTDVYTSIGVGFGILLIKMTGFVILDSIVAILVALLIIKEAHDLCKNALEHLIDVRLTDDEEKEINEIITKVMGIYADQLSDYHKLKTRKSGNKRHIDFHITLNPNLTVKEAHDIVGCLKKEINSKFSNSRVNVHIDPDKNQD